MIKTCILGVLLSLILFATTVHAAAPREHGIAEYNVYVHINRNGSVQVEERIVNRFVGSFNGVFMDIDFSGAGDIVDYSVIEILPDDIMYFTHVQNASIGDDGVYTTTHNRGVLSFQVFRPSNDEYRTFVYRYTLTQGASKFLDYGQFYRALVGTNWEVPIENFSLVVTFEEPDTAGQFTYELTGHANVFSFSGNTDIRIEMFDIPPGQFQAINVVFPADWLANAPLTNRNMDDRPFPWPFVILLGSLLSIIVISIGIITVLSWPHKVDFDEKYYTELPGDNGPAIMSYLMGRAVSTGDVLATLLNMARKRILTIENEEDYRFIIIPDIINQGYDLKPHESYLLDWLFQSIGNGECVSIGEINQVGQDQATAVLFHENYNKWANIVEGEAKDLDYFESYWRRTPSGQLEYKKWQAFRRYLKHFKQVEQSFTHVHEFWENFLPYAVSLGVAKNVMKHIPESGDSFNSTSMVWFALLNLSMINNCNSVISTVYSQGQSYVEGNSSGSTGGSLPPSGGGSGGGAF